MQPVPSVIPHVAGIDAPVGSKVELQKTCHPVALIILRGKVLKLHTGGDRRGPLVQEVGHDDVRQADEGPGVRLDLVVFLQRVRN